MIRYREHTIDEDNHLLSATSSCWSLKCRICGKHFVQQEKYNQLKEMYKEALKEKTYYKSCQERLKLWGRKDYGDKRK